MGIYLVCRKGRNEMRGRKTKKKKKKKNKKNKKNYPQMILVLQGRERIKRN